MMKKILFVSLFISLSGFSTNSQAGMKTCLATVNVQATDDPVKAYQGISKRDFRSLHTVDVVSELGKKHSLEVGELKKQFKENYRDLFVFLVKAGKLKTFIHAEANLCLVRENETTDLYELFIDAEHIYFTNQMNRQSYDFLFRVHKTSGRLEVLDLQ